MARKKHPVYPEISPEDVCRGGSVSFWRNEAGKPFGMEDLWKFSAPWALPDEIEGAYLFAKGHTEVFGQKHKYAWDTDFGYLSPDLHHCGVGFTVTGEFHLEGLSIIGDLPAVTNAIEALRFEWSAINDEGVSQAGHIIGVRTGASMGVTEEDLLRRAKCVFRDVLTQEINARKVLVEEMPRRLHDAFNRSICLLARARLLSHIEAIDLLSPVILGVSMGFIEGITLNQVQKLLREQCRDFDEEYGDDSHPHAKNRDLSDGANADSINYAFRSVRYSDLAKEYILGRR